MRYVVIGGAGAMGRITVRDLIETAPQEDEVIIADYDEKKAMALVESMGSSRVKSLKIDVRDRNRAIELLAGATVILNCVQYQYNLDIMEIALGVGAHYLDLGGLFHMTRKQMELHDRFYSAGLTALLGIGGAPGISNILARYAADQFDMVREIHIRLGSCDLTRYSTKPALLVPYSLKTVLEEFSFEPAIFTKGKFKFVSPMSGQTPHNFAPPVGVKRPMYTLHSEVATLPLSYKAKKIKEVSFKIAFGDEFLDRVKFLRDIGMASHDPVDIQGIKVCPIDVLNTVAMSQPPAKRRGNIREHEIIRAVVKGIVHDKHETWIVDCHTRGMPKWNIGIDIDTGSPPSIAAQMIARGEITERGACPPEVAVSPAPFFKELKKRGMVIKVQKNNGWAH